MAARMPMRATTMVSSISVNPRRPFLCFPLAGRSGATGHRPVRSHEADGPYGLPGRVGAFLRDACIFSDNSFSTRRWAGSSRRSGTLRRGSPSSMSVRRTALIRYTGPRPGGEQDQVDEDPAKERSAAGQRRLWSTRNSAAAGSRISGRSSWRGRRPTVRTRGRSHCKQSGEDEEEPDGHPDLESRIHDPLAATILRFAQIPTPFRFCYSNGRDPRVNAHPLPWIR